MVKRIPLTRGKFAIVDDADFERLNRWKWFALAPQGGNCSFYAARTRRKSDGPGPQAIRMHREVCRAPKHALCDHINGDTLDNRRENLRLADSHQNVCNSRRPSQSGLPRGVRRSGQTFIAEINCRGERIRVGGFSCAKAAADEYDRLAKKLHGEFAVLNNGGEPPARPRLLNNEHPSKSVSNEQQGDAHG